MSRRSNTPPASVSVEPETPATEPETGHEPASVPGTLPAPVATGGHPGASEAPSSQAITSQIHHIGANSMLSGKRIGIIGAGAMGSALCRGLIHANATDPKRIVVADIHPDHVQNLHTSLGIKVAENNIQIARFTDIILLAVKPYTVATVLDEIADSLKRDGGKPLPLIICIAAGIPIAKIEAHLKEPIPVIRAMPNTPSQVGSGACAFCTGTHADDTHRQQATAIFRSVGNAVEVPETMMDAVTALSGSGPAYVYLMIEALVDGGVKVGMPRDIAYKLAAQTVLGAAQMVIDTGLHPAQLRDMVTTPAGTTIEALASMEHSGVRAALIDAVVAAHKRSRELA